MEIEPKQLLGLIGKAPDPAADRRLLESLVDRDSPDVRWLVEHLHTDDDLQRQPLRELLPGIALAESPTFSIQLSVRAANALGKADAGTLRALAGFTPAEVLALPSVGVKVAEEILGLAVSEWAAAYLGQVGSRLENGASAVVPNAERRMSLIQAFAGIEMPAAFEVFRLRYLEPDSQPTQSQVAETLGISPARVPQHESSIRTLLLRQMQDEEWPLAVAVDDLRKRLGAVARPFELDEALAAIDLAGDVLPEGMPHRRALLLWLADLQVSSEWVSDREIEEIAEIVLSRLVEDGSADLDAVSRKLGRLGVREDLQLPWIVSRFGYRAFDGKLIAGDEMRQPSDDDRV